MPTTRSSLNAYQLWSSSEPDFIEPYNTPVDAARELKEKHSIVTQQARKLQSTLLAKQAEMEQMTLMRKEEALDCIPRDKFNKQIRKFRNSQNTVRCQKNEIAALQRCKRHQQDDLRSLTGKLITTQAAMAKIHTADYVAQLAATERELEGTSKELSSTAEKLEAASKELESTRKELVATKQELDALRHVYGDLEQAKEDLKTFAHLQCQVCFENPNRSLLECGHAFCDECVGEMYRGPEQVECPCCRRLVSVQDVRKVFLSSRSDRVVIELSDSESEWDAERGAFNS